MCPVKVVAVTPVHNRRNETLRCLRSLFGSDLSDIAVHVIVVDDGSTDGSAEAIRQQFPNVEILTGNGNLWYTGGMNLGLAGALEHDPDYILGFNNDSIFDGQCLRRLVECGRENPRSVVGAILLDWETPHKLFQVSPRWETWTGGFRHWRHQTIWTIPQKPWKVDLIVGNCVLFPAEAVKEVGLMNIKKFPQYGDAEYTPRMKRNGWRLLIEPKARIFCKPNDVVGGFRNLSAGTQFRALFLDKTGPYSLKRRFNATLYGAPTKIHGLIAFVLFFIRLAAGRNMEGSWGEQRDERPLAEMFSRSTVDHRNEVRPSS